MFRAGTTLRAGMLCCKKPYNGISIVYSFIISIFIFYGESEEGKVRKFQKLIKVIISHAVIHKFIF